MTATSTAARQRRPPRTIRAAAPARSAVHAERIDPTYYWMIMPVLALFGFFITLPALVGVFFSFTNYAGYGDWKFIGLTNYVNIFKDPTMLQSYMFTFVFALTTTVVVNVVALAIALGLNAKIKWRTGIRAVFFIPMVLSALIVVLRVQLPVLQPRCPTLAEKLGITPLATSILANENWAWLAIVIVTVWQAAPGTIIIYLAGLQAIPSEVYEAASTSTARAAWRQFRSLTLPLIVGYLVINIILGFKGFLGAYEIIVGADRRRPGHRHQSGRHAASSPASPAATTPTRWPTPSSTS